MSKFKVLSVISIVCGCFQSSAQTRTLTCKAPEGAKVYLSTQSPRAIYDTLLYNSQLFYLGQNGEERVILKTSEAQLEGTVYVITEKKGFELNVDERRGVAFKNGRNLFVGQLGPVLKQKSERELFAKVEEVNWATEFDMTNEFNDRFSYIYQSIKAMEDERHLNASEGVKSLLNLGLDRLGYYPDRKFNLNDYENRLQIFVDIHFSYTSKFSTRKIILAGQIYIKDSFGQLVFQEKFNTIVPEVNQEFDYLCGRIEEVLKRQEVQSYSSNILKGHKNSIRTWDSLKIEVGMIDSTLEGTVSNVVSVLVNNGHGSGIVIGKDGYILTNHHVIASVDQNAKVEEADDYVANDILDPANAVKVKLAGGIREYDAEIVRSDPFHDVALLKVNRSFEKTISLSETDNVVGQKVYTVGSPLDTELIGSISEGYYTGHRELNGFEVLQISASVNPGNSGGALFNEKFELIGVVDAKLVGYGVNKLGFAIPANKIEEYLKIKFD